MQAIQSAKNSIEINIYEFSSDTIQDALLLAIKRGVRIRILIEGDPVGGMSNSGKETMATLLSAMKSGPNSKSTIFLMTKKAGTNVKRRFAFDHAKYMVIDSARAFVSSENWTDTGQAASGMIGNRGWHALIDQPSLASELQKLFSADTDTQFGDVLDLRKSRLPQDFVARPNGGSNSNSGTRRPIPGFPRATGTVDAVRLASSPNANAAIAQFIQEGSASVNLQFMTLPLTWKESGRPNPYMNPIVAELVQAARTGANVRVLLNDENSFRNPPSTGTNPPTAASGNLKTVCALIEIARNENLRLDGRIIDTKRAGITYIHNKGITTDSRNTWVSSINGTRNSVINNRETAIAIQSRDAAKYFDTAFIQDWTVSSPVADSDCSSISPSTLMARNSLNVLEMRLAQLLFGRLEAFKP